jgi:hypothetical protein
MCDNKGGVIEMETTVTEAQKIDEEKIVPLPQDVAMKLLETMERVSVFGSVSQRHTAKRKIYVFGLKYAAWHDTEADRHDITVLGKMLGASAAKLAGQHVLELEFEK